MTTHKTGLRWTMFDVAPEAQDAPPREPTPEMIAAGNTKMRPAFEHGMQVSHEVRKAMYDAAPAVQDAPPPARQYVDPRPGHVVLAATPAAPQEDAPLLARLRDTPNWLRQEYGQWKDATSVYDRAPFEAADRIESLVAEIEFLRHCIDRCETYFDPDAIGISGVPGRYPTFALAVEAARRFLPDWKDTNRG